MYHEIQNITSHKYVYRYSSLKRNFKKLITMHAGFITDGIFKAYFDLCSVDLTGLIIILRSL